MKKWERALLQILYSYFEKDQRFMSQKRIAENCGISIGSVNLLIKKLNQLGAIEIRPQGFRIIDVPRILLYWANTRSFYQDIIGRVSTSTSVEEIEKHLPAGFALTCFSAFKRKFRKVLHEYDQIYVYGSMERLRKMFRDTADVKPNEIIVLKPDHHLMTLSHQGAVPFAQMYVDLWQIGSAGKPYIDELNARIHWIEVGTIRGIIRRTRKRV